MVQYKLMTKACRKAEIGDIVMHTLFDFGEQILEDAYDGADKEPNSQKKLKKKLWFGTGKFFCGLVKLAINEPLCTPLGSRRSKKSTHDPSLNSHKKSLHDPIS